MTNPVRIFLILLAGVLPLVGLRADIFPEDLGEQFTERTRSLVAVEYFIQREIDRQPREAVALVLDAEGLLVLIDSAFPKWMPVEKFREFKLFLPGEGGEGYDAEYLGRDHREGWHYLRAAEEAREHLVPVRRFEQAAQPGIGAPVWGIGLMSKRMEYRPYFMHGRVGVTHRVPLLHGYANEDLAIPGGPVFDAKGAFAGWAQNGMPDEVILMTSRNQMPVALRDPRESAAFLFAEDFFANVGRVPETPEGDAHSWIGVAGMEPIDRDVAEVMNLSQQGALVVSRIIADSPAAKAGLEDGDIIVAVDGETLPKLLPAAVVEAYFQRSLTLHAVGDEIVITVIRGAGRTDVTVTMEAHPTLLHQAERRYFEDLGLTVREFILQDVVARRLSPDEATGVVADFVKPNSPVNTGGLNRNDWIKSIDGADVATFAEAVAALEAIEADKDRLEAVFLIDRQNKTEVIRVKLK